MNKFKIIGKRVITFLMYAPTIIKQFNELWKVLKEIYNKDTLTELEAIKEKYK